MLLSGVTVSPLHELVNQPPVAPQASPTAAFGLSPAQVRRAYGFDQITFENGAVHGDGSGQTIAIVVAYDNPNIAHDLAVFNQRFGLPAVPRFTKVGLNANGAPSTTAFPPVNALWAGEISLDVEWAHAIAPGANILLVEAHSSSSDHLLQAVDYARRQPGVVAVSMSWGVGEFLGEDTFDDSFTTPAGHAGVTFFASSGDNGSPGIWPALSTHVVGVGGTSLSVDSLGNYLSESSWSGSGGGRSAHNAQPSYQQGLTIHNGSAVISANGRRAGPDVAYDSNRSTGLAVYSTNGWGGWGEVGGTSAAVPQWAALMAITAQGRALAGKGWLDGFTQALPALYGLPSADFHDVTTGSNGSFRAGPGYDLVTGRGTPIANLVVRDLIGGTGAGQPPFQAQGTTLTVFGTAGNDTFRFAAGAASFQVTLNGVTYAVSAQITTIVFKGQGGNDSVVLRGGPGQEALTLGPGTAVLSGANYSVRVTGATTITGYGSAADTVTLYDSAGNDSAAGTSTYLGLSGPGYNNVAYGFGTSRAVSRSGGQDVATLQGSAGNDTFTASPTAATLSGPGYSTQASGFAAVTAVGGGGIDVAYLSGAPGSAFVGRSTSAYLASANNTNWANGFRSVYATAPFGNTATAYLYDSVGNDTFVGTPTYAYLASANNLNQANGFRYVRAYSTAGTDIAYLYDSAGPDTFTSTPTRDSVGGTNYFGAAFNFKSVYAYSAGGGQDFATFTGSAGNDVLVFQQASTTLAGPGYRAQASGFARAQANGGGGSDTATFYDAAGNDTFLGQGGLASLSGGGQRISATNFELVRLIANQGGTNRKSIVGGISYLLQTFGAWQ